MRRSSSVLWAPGAYASYMIAERLPIDTVHLRVEEVVGENAPRLAKHRDLFTREVDVDLRAHVDRPGLPRLDVDDVDSPVLQVVHLAPVGRELRVVLESGRRRELASNRWLAGQLVERKGVEVRLAGGAGAEQRGLAIGADENRSRIHADREHADAPANVVEDDLRRAASGAAHRIRSHGGAVSLRRALRGAGSTGVPGRVGC